MGFSEFPEQSKHAVPLNLSQATGISFFLQPTVFFFAKSQVDSWKYIFMSWDWSRRQKKKKKRRLCLTLEIQRNPFWKLPQTMFLKASCYSSWAEIQWLKKTYQNQRTKDSLRKLKRLYFLLTEKNSTGDPKFNSLDKSSILLWLQIHLGQQWLPLSSTYVPAVED